MPFTNQSMDITTLSSDQKLPSAGRTRKKKKPRISPLLLAFDRQSAEAKSLLDQKESSYERMKMRSKRISEVTKLKVAGLFGENSSKGRPREIAKDMHGNYKATVFGSSVYAGVAHVLFNEIVEKRWMEKSFLPPWSRLSTIASGNLSISTRKLVSGNGKEYFAMKHTMVNE